jgi:hypothetical protein
MSKRMGQIVNCVSSKFENVVNLSLLATLEIAPDHPGGFRVTIARIKVSTRSRFKRGKKRKEEEKE